MITYSPGPTSQARSSTQDEVFRRTYTSYYLAVTDDPTIGPKAVRQACPVAIGQFYTAPGETDLGSYAMRINAVEDTSAGDGCQWVVTVEYGQYNALDQQPEDPMTAPPKLSFSTSRFQKVATKDINDDPVLNSAGDPFDPPVAIDNSRPFMAIIRNERSFSPLLANDYKDATNNAPWFGMPELAWKCLDITADTDRDPNGNLYWVVVYEFELNPETWVVPVLDQGLRELNASGKKVKITDSNGSEVDAPWPLNEDGTKKAVGDPGEFIEFHIYKEKDFTTFNFDSFYNDMITKGLLA